MKHTCPSCGTPEAITTFAQSELQGDPPMTGWVTFVEITDQTCACELTDEQQDIICESNDGSADAEDWDPGDYDG